MRCAGVDGSSLHDLVCVHLVAVDLVDGADRLELIRDIPWHGRHVVGDALPLGLTALRQLGELDLDGRLEQGAEVVALDLLADRSVREVRNDRHQVPASASSTAKRWVSGSWLRT